MFHRLGAFIARAWWGVLLLWVAAVAALTHYAPSVHDVTQPGEYVFLPPGSPSRVGETLFKQAFPSDLLGSSVVIVLSRSDGHKLDEADLQFIDETLKPRLQALMPPESDENGAEDGASPGRAKPQQTKTTDGVFPEMVKLETPSTPEVGKLLLSDDGEAALVIMDLTSDFMDYNIDKPVGAIQQVVAELQQSGQMPAELHASYSGSAVVGRDIGDAQADSADAVEKWTLILIVSLLLLVYRAPLPVLVPLATLMVSLDVAMRLLALAAQAGWIQMFEGIEVYTVVVAYGAGVDFSMFLTSRFHEEIQRNDSATSAIERTMAGVGPAILAAAGTVILGIGMMIFASFGKFHQAGISISFSLFVILCAAMTFTPSLLRMMGRYAFWPEPPQHGVNFRTQDVGLVGNFLRRITLHEETHRFWEWLAELVTRRPVTTWLIAMICMAPFAVIGAMNYDRVSYGLISQLAESAPCVQGTRDIAKHFSAGMTGPATVVIRQPDVDFKLQAGQRLIRNLVQGLAQDKQELGIGDIRAVSDPLGLQHHFEDEPREGRAFNRIVRRNAQRAGVINYYLGEETPTGMHTTRLDVVLNADPFSRDSIPVLDKFEQGLRAHLPDELKTAQINLIGPTASIRDLRQVAGGDRARIIVLVTGAVFVVLLVLIRSLPDSIYLMASVIVSFLCTLGVADLVFHNLAGSEFPGLDWTVATFLFTILVAVGQDYNIFLVTRVHEERKTHGPIGSVRHAIVQTAAIITSCGLIMAGTFSALVVGGRLARMNQLGFSLAFGVLLDTMVVRPVLVPAYLAWRARLALKKDGVPQAEDVERASV
jgi:RND superfamily putative drug exporter